MPVRQLPETVVNRIAAGEVVERPASVVKELVENALDAGARRIEVVLAGGGRRLIRVADDGSGMSPEDLSLAVERHATSKLRTAEDLDTITTLGFRGEALPSIASVSRLFLRTKTKSDVEGTEVEFNGGKLVAVRDIAWPGGAEFEVKDLFFNIPARRKFLKSDATESFHITNLVQHYALANPQLELRDNSGTLIRSDDNWMDDPDQKALIQGAGLAPTNNLESAIYQTLVPGQYTALLSGVSNGTGVGLVEIYNLN